eukprot:6165639-Pleurochrysis_carterae.AAC.1
MPSGSALDRSCGTWATEKDEQGGATKTASKRRSRAQRATSSATSPRARSWSRPPILVSIATTSAPRARNSDGSVDAARSSPANATRTHGFSPAVVARIAGGSVPGPLGVHATTAPCAEGAEGPGIPLCSASRLSRAAGLGGFAGLRGGMTPGQPDATP